MGEEPVLELCDLNGIKLRELKKDLYTLDIAYCSNGASSTNFDITLYYGLSNSFDEKLYAINSHKLESSTSVSKGNGSVEHLQIPANFNTFTFFYIYFFGTYKNMEKTKTYTIDNLYYFNREANSVGSVTRESKKRIIKSLFFR